MPLAPLTKPRPKKKVKLRPDQCLNCGMAATGNFCVECGQEIKDHTVALGPLLSDLLAEVVSWDSKLFRTLVSLVMRPGFLTNEYNAGRRVPYLSPPKLYLTLSVVFFLLLPLTPHASLINLDTAPAKAGVTLRTAQQAADTRIKSDADLKEAQADIQESVTEDAPGITLPPLTKPGVLIVRGPASQLSSADFTHLPATVAAYDAQQRDPRRAHDPKLVSSLKRQIIKVKQNPELLSAALLNDISKMMFFLLPAFAASLKLLYLRTKRLYVEHLIFLLHVHAFAFLLMSPLLLVHPSWLLKTLFGALLVYILVAMKVVYQQTWVKTVFKFSLLGSGYLLLLTVSLIGTTFVALWLL